MESQHLHDNPTISLAGRWLVISGCLFGASCVGHLDGDGGDDAVVSGNPGGMPVHHLTSSEYNNTVAHLLGTTLKPADFFPSAAATGFDANVGVLLSVSQVLVQGYYDAAKDLAADAFAGDASRARILICTPPTDTDTACPRKIIEAFGNPISTPGAVPEPPGPQQGLNQGDDGDDHEAHADVMNDLIAMAIQCDVTRVVTHMLDDARSEFEYRNIPEADRLKVGLEYNAGSSMHFHSSQHGPGEITAVADANGYPIITPSNLDFTAINYWLGRKAAELALRLDSIPEGAGTVLDNTVMVFMSEMRTHDHDGYDLPIVMLGGGGVFAQDAHVAYQPLGKDRQLRDLWFTIMRQYFKMDIASFGDQVGGAPNALLQEILA
jgi:uncharacterized protein DUF1587/uncharacterized protein DUF1552